jgi:DNA-directed RNA polymerase specialized sigma24 family protein
LGCGRRRGARQVDSDPPRRRSANGLDGSEPVDILALDDALERLASFARKSRVVELRFFGDLDIVETAAALDVSPQTAQRDWRLAKMWLFRELSGDDRGGA